MAERLLDQNRVTGYQITEQRKKPLEIYDTSLRDGQQGMDVTFSIDGKINVARRVSVLPIGRIEGGWPGANPTDSKFFQVAQDQPFFPKLAAFGMTRRADVLVEDDKVVKELLDSNAPTITFVGKTDIAHVRNVFRIDPEENLRMIEDSVRYAREQGRRVIYDAEHFFDGSDHDKEYAMETVYAAVRGGAETVVLCDTNGGKLPHQVEASVKKVLADEKLHALYRTAQNIEDPETKLPIGIHTHSDRKMGEANALAAVRAGATHVQGTVNGFGERAGNADLLVTMDALADMGYVDLSHDQRAQFVEISRTVSEAAGVEPNPNQPLTGENAGATKAGMHADAQIKDPGAYAFRLPREYGNEAKIVVSSQSGRSTVLEKMKQLRLEPDKGIATTALEKVKIGEMEGYRFAKAEATLELLLRREYPLYIAPFTVTHSEENASILKIGEEKTVLTPTTERTDLIFETLKGALDNNFPNLRSTYMSGSKIQFEDGKVRVFIKVSNSTDVWTTMGVGRTIQEASWEAAQDALEYSLLHPVQQQTE